MNLVSQQNKIISQSRDGNLNQESISKLKDKELLNRFELIEPHLKEENKKSILPKIFYKSTREVEIFISSISERQKEIRDKIRVLPQLIQTQDLSTEKTLIEDQRTSEKEKTLVDDPNKHKTEQNLIKDKSVKTAQIFTASAGSKTQEEE